MANEQITETISLELDTSKAEKNLAALQKAMDKAVANMGKMNDQLYAYGKAINSQMNNGLRQAKKDFDKTGLANAGLLRGAYNDAAYRFGANERILWKKTSQYNRKMSQLSALKSAETERLEKQAVAANRQLLRAVVSQIVDEQKNAAIRKENARLERKALEQRRIELLRAKYRSPVRQSAFTSGAYNEYYNRHFGTTALRNAFGSGRAQTSEETLRSNYYKNQYGKPSFYNLGQAIFDSKLGNTFGKRLNYFYQSGGIGDLSKSYGGRVATQLSYRLANVPLNLATGLFSSIGSTLKNAVTEASKMQDALAKTQAIAGASSGTMDSLAKSIMSVASSSRFTIEELSEATTVLAQAGYSITEINDLLGSVSKLATSTGTSLATSTDILTTSLSLWGTTASDSEKMVDALAVTVNKSKAEISSLANGMTYAGAVASQMGISFEETIAAMGAVTNQGIRNRSTLGTGLRALLTEISQMSPKLAKELKKVGLSVEDIDLRGEGLAKTVEKLKKAGFGVENSIKGLDRRAATFLNALMAGTKDMDELTKAMNENSAAAEGNEARMNTLRGQTARLSNIWKSIATNAGEVVVPVLQSIVEMTADVSEGFMKATQAMKDFFSTSEKGSRKDLEQTQGLLDSKQQVSNYLWEEASKISSGKYNNASSAELTKVASEILAKTDSENLSLRYAEKTFNDKGELGTLLKAAVTEIANEIIRDSFSMISSLEKANEKDMINKIYDPRVIGALSQGSTVDQKKSLYALRTGSGKNKVNAEEIDAALQMVARREQITALRGDIGETYFQQKASNLDVVNVQIEDALGSRTNLSASAGKFALSPKTTKDMEAYLTALAAAFGNKSTGLDFIRANESNLPKGEIDRLTGLRGEQGSFLSDKVTRFADDLLEKIDEILSAASASGAKLKEEGGLARAKKSISALTDLISFLGKKENADKLKSVYDDFDRKIKPTLDKLEKSKANLTSSAYKADVSNVLAGSEDYRTRKKLLDEELTRMSFGSYGIKSEYEKASLATQIATKRAEGARSNLDEARAIERAVLAKRKEYGGLSEAEYENSELQATKNVTDALLENQKATVELKEAMDRQTEIENRTGLNGVFGSATQGLSDWFNSISTESATYALTLEGLNSISSGLKTAFKDVAISGESVSKSFKKMAQSILESLASKAIDKGVDYLGMAIGTAFNFLGAASGASNTTSSSEASKYANSLISSSSFPTTENGVLNLTSSFPRASGGYIGANKNPRRYASGGIAGRDSVHALLMPGEYVMKKQAVDVLGKETLDILNGAASRTSVETNKGIKSTKSAKPVVTNVYVVSDAKEAGMNPNDVIVTIGKDIAQGGQTRQLIQQVVQGRY